MCGKTKSFLIFLLTLSFLIGLSLCLYPIVNGAILDISAEKEANTFLEHLKDHAPPNDDALNLLPTPSEPTRSHAELWNAVTAYNQQIWQEKQSGLSDPWAYEQPSFQLDRYGIEDGIFATISIPRLELTLPLYLGATNEHMASGAVHLSQTSLPVGGNNTNCVIAGHRGWKGAKYFRDIVALVPGDEVIVTNLWEELENNTFLAWGYLEYPKPLSETQISDYELRAAPSRIVAVKEKPSVLDTLRERKAEVKAQKPKQKTKQKEECR